MLEVRISKVMKLLKLASKQRQKKARMYSAVRSMMSIPNMMNMFTISRVMIPLRFGTLSFELYALIANMSKIVTTRIFNVIKPTLSL